MFNWFYALLAKIKGTNDVSTPVEVISQQMNEMRPLPLGIKEFEEWSDRIISGALIPGATVESQKFALCGAIMSIGPTDDHKPDLYFIKVLRKSSANQVAQAKMQYIREEAAAKAAAVKAVQAISSSQPAEVTVAPVVLASGTDKA